MYPRAFRPVVMSFLIKITFNVSPVVYVIFNCHFKQFVTFTIPVFLIYNIQYRISSYFKLIGNILLLTFTQIFHKYLSRL